MAELTVDLGQRAYPIHVGEGTLALLGEELKRLKATRVLLVTNSTVRPALREGRTSGVSARRRRTCLVAVRDAS